jgi:hypothetical protein
LKFSAEGIETQTIVCRVVNGEIGEKMLNRSRSLFLPVVSAKAVLGFRFAPFCAQAMIEITHWILMQVKRPRVRRVWKLPAWIEFVWQFGAM